MSMSIFVKISVMNAEESPEISYKINGMTIDELVRYPKLKLQGEGNFRLDFYRFRREQANTMSPRLFGGTTWRLSVPFSDSFIRAISPNGRGGMPVEKKTPMLSPMTASPVWRIRGNIRPGNVPTGSWNGRWPTTGTAIYWPCNDRRVMRWRPISHTPMRGTVSCRFPIPGRLIRMPMIRTGIWSRRGKRTRYDV